MRARSTPVWSAALILLAGCSAPPVAETAVGEYGSEGVGFASDEYAEQIARIDEAMMAPVRDGRIAGVSISVAHHGEPVAIRGYGWADLELRTPTPEQGVYEIGSVTKQFTTAALLQLQDEGLIDLDAEIGTYLPDFDTKGNRITVRELLDHTSGIRGYTEMPEAYPYFVRRVDADSLMALIAARPFDFPTGEHQIYNNSAFFLAGLILEKVSGMTYEEYVEERLFGALGMDQSHYCSETEIHPGKVNGYEVGPEGLRHKGFIVHNVPYAAGSLCSSAADMATWLTALHSGSVLSDGAYDQLTTPGDLNDGTTIRYGLGIGLTPILGHRAIHHGGGIPGFLTQTLYLPEEDLAVAVLLNTAGPPGPDSLAAAIVEIMVGDETPEPSMYEGDLSALTGTYRGPARGGPMGIRIDAVDGALTTTTVMQGGQPIPEDRQESTPLEYMDGLTFRVGGALYTFEPGDGGSAVLRWDVGSGYSVMQRDS